MYDNPKHIAPLEIWDVDQGKLVSQMPLTNSAVQGGVTWDSDETILAACLADHSLVGFHVETKKQIWEAKNDFPASVMRHPRTGSLYVIEWGRATAPARVRVLNMQTGKDIRQFSIDRPELCLRRFSFDGSLLLGWINGTAANGFRIQVALVNPDTGEIVESFALGSQREFVHDLYLSSDGKRLFIQSSKGEFRIWDRQAQELILSLRDPNVSCNMFALAVDGLAAVGTSTGRGFYLWDGRPFGSDEGATAEHARSRTK